MFQILPFYSFFVALLKRKKQLSFLFRSQSCLFCFSFFLSFFFLVNVFRIYRDFFSNSFSLLLFLLTFFPAFFSHFLSFFISLILSFFLSFFLTFFLLSWFFFFCLLSFYLLHSFFFFLSFFFIHTLSLCHFLEIIIFPFRRPIFPVNDFSSPQDVLWQKQRETRFIVLID